MANLPQDIFNAAIDHLWDDPLALRTCALVSHDWLHQSRFHLFEEVTISYPIHHRAPSPISSPVSTVLNSIEEQLEASTELAGHSSHLPAETSNPILDLKLADYIRDVTVHADGKPGEIVTRWTPVITSHLHLQRLAHLRSLRLVRFAFASFADLVPTIQALPTLEVLRCEEVGWLTPPSLVTEPASTDRGLFEAISAASTGHSRTSLKTLSLSVANNIEAILEDREPDTAARALHSAREFMRPDLLKSVTSLELFDASTVLGWLPAIKRLGPQLHHIGIALHDVQLGDGELVPQHFNDFPGPSKRDTIARVYNALQACTSLRTLHIRYDAEDTISLRMVQTGMPSGADDGPVISSCFLDEAVRLFSGSERSPTRAPPFPTLRQLTLQLVTTARSLRDCAPACAALADAFASHDYPAFARLVVTIEEPALLGIFFGDKEVNDAACVRKAAAVRSGLLRPFEERGIALEVAVVQRQEEP